MFKCVQINASKFKSIQMCSNVLKCDPNVKFGKSNVKRISTVTTRLSTNLKFERTFSPTGWPALNEVDTSAGSTEPGDDTDITGHPLLEDVDLLGVSPSVQHNN